MTTRSSSAEQALRISLLEGLLAEGMPWDSPEHEPCTDVLCAEHHCGLCGNDGAGARRAGR